MSYSIVTPGYQSTQPSYTYLSGDLGAFWNKKSVRKRCQARRAERKASGKKVKAGKIVAAVLTGGISLAVKKKKTTKKAPARPVTVPTSPRPVTSSAPLLEAETAALKTQAAAAAQAVPAAVPFPWLALGLGVGAVAFLGLTAAIVLKR